MKPFPDGGGDACANLYRWTFSSHRMARTDAQHAGQKLPESDPRRNLSLVEVIGGFGLRDAATASFREKLCQPKSRNQAHQRRYEDVAEIRGAIRTAGTSSLDGQRKQDCG